MESKNFSAKVIHGGRVTIPQSIRIDLDIKNGDRVNISLSKKPKLKEGVIL